MILTEHSVRFGAKAGGTNFSEISFQKKNIYIYISQKIWLTQGVAPNIISNVCYMCNDTIISVFWTALYDPVGVLSVLV